MSELTTIIDALYNNFLLRDLFAKMVPGYLVLAAAVFQNQNLNGAIGTVELSGWPIILMVSGFAWIMGFAIQGVGELFRVIKHHPDHLDDSNKRYSLRVRFRAVASPIELQQVERYAIIKEAVGNGATAIFLLLLIITLRITLPGDLDFSPKVLLPGCLLFLFGLVLVHTNRNHARKHYEYMQSVVDENTKPE